MVFVAVAGFMSVRYLIARLPAEAVGLCGVVAAGLIAATSPAGVLGNFGPLHDGTLASKNNHPYGVWKYTLEFYIRQYLPPYTVSRLAKIKVRQNSYENERKCAIT